MKTFFNHNLKWSCALTLAALLSPGAAFATNGMFLIGSGSRSVAMGGAAIANPQDSFTGAVNPAAIVEVGTRADLEAMVFIPKAAARLGNVHVESSSDLFLMPAMGMVLPLDNETVMGFSFVPVGGGGSNYRTNFYNTTDGNVGVNLMVAQMNPTLAQRLNDTHTVGGNLIIGVQRFKAWGFDQFNTFTVSGAAKDMHSRGSEFSYGLGLRLGWLATYKDLGLNLGAAYTTPTYMKRFEKYKELFAEHGDINTPGNLGVGASLKITPKINVALDIVRIYYEGTASIANTGPNLPGGSVGPFPVSKEVNGLGEDEGLGFGWRDQTVYKLGFEYKYAKDLTLRAGWNYGKSPIPEEREILFNLVAPATTQWHVTLGGTYKISREMELNFAYMHAFTTMQQGPTYITTKDVPGPNTGSIEMYQNAFSVGIGFTL